MGRKPVSQMNEKELEQYREYLARRRAKYNEEKKEKNVVPEKKDSKSKKAKIKYDYNAHVADFETSTEVWYNQKKYVEVWAWAITDCHINSDNPIDMGDCALVHTNDGGEEDVFQTFLDHLNSPLYKNGDKIYFHNLKFDGNFLLYNLERLGFKDVTNEKNCKATGRKKVNEKTFSAVVAAGAWYCIRVNLGEKIIEFRDSAKRIQMSVRQMAEEFKLPILKGEIDYNRDPSLKITKEEKGYIRNDVLIVAEVLRQQYREGFTDLTTASFAFRSYKAYLKERDLDFKKLFPELSEEDEAFVRATYDGGEVYCNYRYSRRIIGNPKNPNIIGYTWDINSMYPAVMSAMPMPVGKPYYTTAKTLGFDRDRKLWKHWRGDNKRYFIQIRRVVATVKPGKLPSIGVVVGFGKRVYGENIDVRSLYLADVRFERLLQDYDIKELDLGRIIWFKARSDLFYDYIKGIVAEKNAASIEGNVMRKAMSKVKMNSLYGKYGQKRKTVSTFFTYDEDDGLINNNYESDCGSKYVPIASIITAEARELLITQANKFGSNAVSYMDTDSIHVINKFTNVVPYRRRPMPDKKDKELKLEQMNDVLPQDELRRMLIEFEEGRPNEVWCDEFDLGAFKVEGSFGTAKWLRAKTYIEGTLASKEEVDSYYECLKNKDPWKEEWIIIPQRDVNPEYYLKGVVKGAGIPDEQKREITYENFEIGKKFTGKKMPKKVKGGVILVESEYEIKEDYTVLTNQEI